MIKKIEYVELIFSFNNGDLSWTFYYLNKKNKNAFW